MRRAAGTDDSAGCCSRGGRRKFNLERQSPRRFRTWAARHRAAVEVLKLHLDLAIRDTNALEQFLADLQDPTSPTYHKWTTPAEFAARFGPNPADVARVAGYLKVSGFQVNSADAITRGIDFTGTVAQAERAFGVRIGITQDGQNFANLNDPILPADIAPAVNAIEGLDNLVHAVSAAAIANRADGTLASPDFQIGNSARAFGPQDV